MSDLLCLATIALAGLTQASLQLSFGALILLYHSSLGRHRRRQTRFLARSYILGVMAMSFLMVCTCGFVMSRFLSTALPMRVMAILVGALCAGAVVMRLFYFRQKTSTQLWVPKSLTNYIQKSAKQTNSKVEAFALGVVSGLAELPLSIILALVAANAMLAMAPLMQLAGALLFAALSVAPLFYLKLTIKSGRNAIDAQKWRTKNKKFLRNIACFSFLTLAFFVVGFWMI